MLIKINNSQLFNTNPAKRFAEQYHVKGDMWTELWKRYKLLGYTFGEMAEYYEMKVKKGIRTRQIRRWVFLTEIYIIAKPAGDKGALVVNTEMFGTYEKRVIEEVIRHMKAGSTKNSNLMV